MLKGKTAVITGASRGIGKNIALKFAENGAGIILNASRKSDELFSVLELIRNMGVKAEVVTGDISDHKTTRALIEKADECFDTIDIIVNNAGVTRDNLLIRMNEDQWDEVMQVNVKGAFLLTKAAARIMMKNKKGRIINISSVVGVNGNAGQCNYSASKAALLGFTKSIAKELGPKGITCNAIAPGFIKTDMTDILSDKVKDLFLKKIPLNRFGKCEEVAELAVFLASDKSGYISGEVIFIDGGLHL